MALIEDIAGVNEEEESVNRSSKRDKAAQNLIS